MRTGSEADVVAPGSPATVDTTSGAASLKLPMIAAEVLPYVIAAEARAGAASAKEAATAAALTRAEYGSAARWALGLLGTVLAAVAIPAGVFSVPYLDTTFQDHTGMMAAMTLPLLAIAVIFGVPSLWLLFVLHRAGRRLSRAAAYWGALAQGYGYRTTKRGHRPRLQLGFGVDLLMRLVTSAFALLLIACVLLETVPWILTDPTVSLVHVVVLWVALAAAVCAGQLGGVVRVWRVSKRAGVGGAG
ncbi:hypothetical protein [Microbacterium sp.]|uniref:hypothetical protein n=1 Tax=Microbacterium sp. TaxID=51671 RepID=UPI0039E250F9